MPDTPWGWHFLDPGRGCHGRWIGDVDFVFNRGRHRVIFYLLLCKARGEVSFGWRSSTISRARLG